MVYTLYGLVRFEFFVCMAQQIGCIQAVNVVIVQLFCVCVCVCVIYIALYVYGILIHFM